MAQKWGEESITVESDGVRRNFNVQTLDNAGTFTIRQTQSVHYPGVGTVNGVSVTGPNPETARLNFINKVHNEIHALKSGQQSSRVEGGVSAGYPARQRARRQVRQQSGQAPAQQKRGIGQKAADALGKLFGRDKNKDGK